MTTFDQLFKQCMLETFKTAVAFFKENEINYFACCGTAIGAVRHHNIIPWDDDIDIYVPRVDYNRLLTLRDLIREKGLEIQAFPDDGYDHSFMKILNMNTVVWENRREPILSGIWVDVFPLDYYNDSEENRIRYNQYHDFFIQYQNTVKPYPLKIIIEDLLKGHLRGVAYKIKHIITKRKREFYKQKFLRIDKDIQITSGQWFVSYPEGLFHMYKKEWFSDYVLLPFGDFEIRLPIGYHEYLTDYYGDYMTPPPLEKQVPFHGIYYTNLKEKLSIDEITKRIRDGLWKNNNYECVYEK